MYASFSEKIAKFDTFRNEPTMKHIFENTRAIISISNSKYVFLVTIFSELSRPSNIISWICHVDEGGVVIAIFHEHFHKICSTFEWKSNARYACRLKSSSSLSPEPYFLKPTAPPWRGFRGDALGRPAAGRVRVRCRGGARRGARRRGARRCGRPSPRALSLRSQPIVKMQKQELSWYISL